MAHSLKTYIREGISIQALFGYHIGAVILGLATHPYVTVQNIVRKKIPSSILLFPSICWISGIVLLRLLDHFLFSVLPYIGLWWFLFVWVTSFLFIWQFLLAYLFIRFSNVMREH